MNRYYATDNGNSVSVFDGETGKGIKHFPKWDDSGLASAAKEAEALTEELNESLK